MEISSQNYSNKPTQKQLVDFYAQPGASADSKGRRPMLSAELSVRERKNIMSKRYFTAGEVKQDHVEKLGDELGNLYHELWNEVAVVEWGSGHRNALI